ncbi:MAG: ATP-binding cassette domain-containing protein [Coriobacteriia bacterium]|nr:ATP-binding cassette domain-containing protein [Coriobacteriia bacterium]
MKDKVKKILIVVFWIAVWGVIATIIASPLILASPIDVAQSLLIQVTIPKFWITVGLSLFWIFLGFILAFILGTILALLSYRFKLFHDFINPLIQFMKSAPVVCFIVLLLVWVGTSFLDVITVIIAVVPIYFYAIYEACQHRNTETANMLKVFEVPGRTIWKVFEWPSALPYVKQATKSGIGIAWKSGVTAQMIGAVMLTIGEGIYNSKVMLDSGQLLMWMFIVILLSWICEKIMIAIINKSNKTSIKRVLKKIKPRELKECDDPLIKIGNLSKSYDKKLFENFNLNVHKKDRFTLMAETGTGKTTLIKIILGLVKPDSGTIDARCKFSVVFQDDTLLKNLNVKDNIAIATQKQIDTIDLVPNKMPDELSGGMKRCAQIERALKADSHVVVMDEPLSGLDKKTKEKAINYINENLGDRALILVTHDKLDTFDLNAQSILL